MKKGLTALAAATALLAVPSASAAETPSSATVTNAIVSIDGRRTEILSFQINNNNYFMLRDVAEALNGTSKQFDVSWAQTESATILHGGQAYQAGEQQAVPYLPDESAALVSARIQYNDTLGSPHRTEIYACNYGNFNFYRLRDLGRLMDFYIGWENGVVAIDTNLRSISRNRIDCETHGKESLLFAVSFVIVSYKRRIFCVDKKQESIDWGI